MVTQHIVPLYRLELIREKDLPYRSVTSIEAAAEVFHEMLDSSPVEKLAVIHCNSSLQMIGAELIAVGSIERVSAVPADIFRGALRNNAATIWMAHNHVDGNVKASLPDYMFTERALKAAEILEIGLEDHLVIGPGAHYSIRQHSTELALEVRQKEKARLQQTLLGGADPTMLAKLLLLGKGIK